MSVWFWRRVYGLAMVVGGVVTLFGGRSGLPLRAARRCARARGRRMQSARAVLVVGDQEETK